MNDSKILLARKYARAFLLVFIDKLSAADFERSKQLCEFLASNLHGISLLKFPGIADQTKEHMLKALCKRFSLPEPFEHLVRLLLEHHRLELLRPVLQALIALHHEHTNTLVFAVTSAHALDEASLERIKQLLIYETGKNIVLSYATDPGLIAGIRVQSTTLLWEYSIAKQLNRLSLTSIV